MAKVETTIKEIKKEGVLLGEYLGKKIQNGESVLILKQGILYKIIEEMYRKKRQSIMEFFHDTPNNLPFDLDNLYYENHHFFCYSMPFYKNYPTLYEVLKSDITLKERKQIALELLCIYQKFLNYQIVYYDWHSKNCVYKGNVKVLDVDSGLMTTAIQYDAKARINLFHLCIELLLAEDFDYDWNLGEIEIEDFVNEQINKEEMFLSRTIPLEFEFMKKEIMGYTNTMIDCQKELLLQKWKVL